MAVMDELVGFAAAACVLLTFCMQSMGWLRLMALLSNALFIAYAHRLGLLPVLALHLMLLPVNIAGLRREIAAGRVIAPAWLRRGRRALVGARARRARWPWRIGGAST